MMGNDNARWISVGELPAETQATLGRKFAQVRKDGDDLLAKFGALRSAGMSELDAWGEAGVLVARPLARALVQGRDPVGYSMGLIAYLLMAHHEHRDTS